MFNGFTEETQDFLWGLRLNNDRSWFIPRKETFERVVKKPMDELAFQTLELMQERFEKEDFQVHIARIYRDARRLYGRGPYKDHLWFTIHTGQRHTGGPANWFEIGPEGYSLGMGMWSEKASLSQFFRKRIDADPKAFAAIARAVDDGTSQIWGDEYKKKKGERGPLIDPWYNRKNVNIGKEGPFSSLVADPNLPRILADQFAVYLPMYHFMLDVWHEAQAYEMDK